MGIFGQTVLLLWKNILLRLRFPGILLLEVLWPILVVGIVAIMRTSVPPIKHANCHYQPRAMPSAGMVPFMQTFICNLDNKCYDSESKLNVAKQNSEKFTKLSYDLAPYLGSSQVLDILAISSKGSNLISQIEKVVEDKHLMDGLDRYMNISSYFRDPERVKEILVNDYELSKTVVDAVMNSKLNIAKLLNLTGAPDLRAVVCDPNKLDSYLKFPADADIVKNISDALCHVNDSQISDLADKVIRQLNITAVMEVVELFEKLKEKFGVSNTLSLIFNSIAEMFETVMSASSIIQYLGEFAGVPNIADVIKKIPSWINKFSSLTSALNVFEDVVFTLEPLMGSLHVENSTAWKIVNDGIKIGTNIDQLVENQWNGTAEEFVQPFKDLMNNMMLFSQKEGNQEITAVLGFVIKIDWLHIYTDIRTTRSLNKETILHILEDFQEMFEKLPYWSVVQKIARIAQHGMDMVSILTEKSKELKYALRNISNDNFMLKNELNRLFQYGPVVTRALLEALTSTQVLSDIMRNASTYQSVCNRVVAEIQTKVPDDVFKDIFNTLCAGDVMDALNVIIERIRLSEIRDVINATVREIEILYHGDFYARIVPLSELYNHCNRMITAISSYINDEYTWTELFLNITFNSLDFNEAGWHQVKNLLNEDFLTKGFLGLLRGVGETLQWSSVSGEIAPYLHMMSHLSKMVYDFTNDFTAIYASDSAFIKAVRLFTNYMPDIVKGISLLWNHDMASVFILASSTDPLNTFCNSSYISKMNMSAQVPVGELNSLICDTDWIVAIQNVMKPAQDVKDAIVQMLELFNNDTKGTFDLKADWSDMINYTEQIISIFNSGNVVNMNFVQGYMTLIDNMNVTKMEEGFEVIFQILENVTTEDLKKFADFVIKILENLDNTLRSDNLWHYFKWLCAWIDSSLDVLIDSTELLQNKSIQAVLEMYPPEVRRMTTLLASAYPQFIAALKNIILDPTKLLNFFLQEGFKAPDCVSHYVSDYTLLSRNSSLHSLERFICDLNVTALPESFRDGPPVMKAYSQRVIELLLYGNATVDWSKFTIKIHTFVDQLSSQNFNGRFDFYPFNISAITMSWKEFYRAAELLKSMDLYKILNLAFKIQDLTIKLIGEAGDSDIISDITTALVKYNYVNYHFIKMITTEMAFFNASKQVVLFEYLWSSELKKLTDLIVRSPEINAVAVATLQRFLTSPEEVILVVTNFDGLCSNLSLFSKIFAVEASSLDHAVLQKTVCNLNMNFTLLLEQVESNRPSIKEFMDAMKVLSTNFDINDIKVDFSTLISDYKLFTDLLQSLLSNPPIILLSEDENWMNITLYRQHWEALWNKLASLEKDLHNSSKLLDWESSMIEILLATIEKVPGTEKALVYVDVILDSIQDMLDHTISNYEDLKQYTNLNRVLGLLNFVPEAVQSLIYTVLIEPEKTLRWTVVLQSWTKPCSTNVSDIISVPPELDFSMADFLHTACNIDIDALLNELLKYQGVAALENLIKNQTFPNVNSSALHQKFGKVFKSMTDLINESPSLESNVLARLINVNVWEQIGGHINTWLNKTSFEFSSPEKISQSVIDIIQMVFDTMPPDVNKIYNQAVAVAEVIMDQMMFMLTSNTLQDAFRDLPTWQTLSVLLNELPELFETVVYTSLLHPEKISDTVLHGTSWETFCNVAENVLVLPPNSTFDYKNWMSILCSVNLTRLIDEVRNYSLTRKIESILNSTYSGNITLKSVVHKAETIINKVNRGIDINGHVFDASVWDKVIKRVTSWTRVWTSSIAEEMGVNWSSFVAKTLLTTLEKVKDTGQALAYIDAVLDLFQSQVDQLNGGFDGLYNYTNANIMLKLLKFAPEAVQTVFYTVMTEPSKTARWSVAFQSKKTFCKTPSIDILSVPAVLNFNISDYLDGVCELNIEVLVQELAQYQGTDRLGRVLQHGVDDNYNISKMLDKFHHVLKSITDSVDNAAALPKIPFFQLFNVTVWEEVGRRIEVWSDKSIQIYSTPEQITRVVDEILNMMFGKLPDEMTEIYEKTTAIADIILSQILVIINTDSLNASLHDLPGLQTIVGLLNELPELYETVLYSSMHFPEKIAAKVSHLTSLEAFCGNNPQDMFTVAPNSSFDVTSWFLHLCSINITSMVYELQDYTIAKEIGHVLNGSYSGQANISSIIDKAETIVSKLKGGMKVNDRVFDPNVWDSALDRVNSWIWPYKSIIEFLKDEQKLLLRSFIAYIENTAGAGDMIYYVDAIVDIIDNSLDKSHVNFSEALQEFPTLRAIIELVEQAPDIIDTTLYTLLVHPEKVLEWPSAVQSFTVFCNKDTSKIMSVAPDSNFNVESYIRKLCGVSIDRLISELTSYQGFNQLHQIITGNRNNTINVTALLQKTDDIFVSLDDYYNNPLYFVTLDLQLFNTTVWEMIGRRVQAWSNDITVSKYVNAQTVAQILELFFGSLESLSEEFKDAYNKALAITSVLVEEIQMVIEASSLQEAMKDVPSLQLLLKLANQAPELLETLVYTSVFHSDKVTHRVKSLVSFESFCEADINEMFSKPPDSTFDLKSWISMLCSLNFTDLENQLADYKTVKDIERIVNGSFNHQTNLTSVVDRIDSLINRIKQGVNKSDRLLNGSIWTYMMTRIDKWIKEYNIYDTALMSANIADLVLSQMMDEKTLQNMAKSLNTINLFMNVTINKLRAVADGTISLSSMFANADELVKLIEAYIRVGKNLPKAWISGEFDSDKLLSLFGNISQLHMLCEQASGLTRELTNATQPSETVRDMSMFICSVVDESLQRAVKDFVNYDETEKQLAAIWSSSYVSPGFSDFTTNVEIFASLIHDLANKSFIVNSSLTNSFDFTSTIDALKKISTDPKMIFRLLKLLGLVIESPLHQEQDIVKVLSGINTFALMPIVNLLDALKARGVTLMSVASNPETLLDALSTIVNFDTQYSVIETVVIKPQLQWLVDSRSTICNNTGYKDYLLTQGLDTLSLPVPWQQLWALVCEAQDTEMILKNMKEVGLTAVQTMVLLEKMSPVGKALPEMYNHEFGWIDLMSSFEKLADLVTQSKVDQSGVQTLKSAWESVKDILFDKSLGSLLSYLNLMDGSVGQSEDWIMFKQFLRFFSSTLQFINGNLSKFGQGTEVKLEDVLPNSNEVANLIKDVFGISDTAEILTSVIDPVMFYRITLFETWDEVCAENNSLSNYFHFPEGTNVLAVRAHLCKAVTSRSSSFQQLLSLFEAGDMLKQLDMMIGAEFNDSIHNNTVWDAFHKTVLEFIHSAENFQNAHINTSSSNSWFSTIVNALYSLQERQGSILASTCSSIIYYLNNTEGFKQNRRTVSRVITALNLVSDITKLLPELDELICILVNETGFDLSGLVKKLQRIGFWNDLIKAVDQFTSPPEIINCSAPLNANLKLMKMINSTLGNNDLNINMMSQCLSRAGDNFESMMTSFTQSTNFLKEIITVMQIPELQKLLQDPNLFTMLSFFITGVRLDNKATVIYLADLLQNSVSAADYLMNTLGWSAPIVNSFLNASVNKDWVYFLTKPTEVVKEILCNSDKLQQVLNLPEASPVNITEISLKICTKEVTNTINLLKNISVLPETVKEMSGSAVNILNGIEKIVTDVVDTVINFEDLITLLTKFMASFDINVLKDYADILDEIAQGHTLTKLATSLDHIVDDIAILLPANTASNVAIEVMRKIIKGILSLDILKDFILGEVQVKNMVTDSKNLMLYLTSELGFSDIIAQEIMNAIFSSRLFLGILDQPSYTCEEVLKMIIIMNSTQVTDKNVSDSLCSLDEAHLRDLVQKLIPELNIGILIAKYVTNSAAAIMEACNLTVAEFDDTFNKMYFGLSDLKKVSDIIKESPNGTDIINMFGGEHTDSFIALNKLTPVLCGGEVADIYDVSFLPGIPITTNSDLQNDLKNGIDDNELDLPNEFCVSMYENIKKSGFGSILWNYLKPILRGKILYTPDNAVTRSIVNKASKLFNQINEVSRVAKIWAEESINLISLAEAAFNAKGLKAAPQYDFIKGLLEMTEGIRVERLIYGLDTLKADNFDKSQLSTLQKVAEIFANYSSCIVTNRFQPVETETALEQEAYRLSQSKTFFAGIVFLHVGEKDNATGPGGRKRRQAVSGIPEHVGYKIRMDVDNVMDTNRLKSALWKMSKEDNIVEDMRYIRGFIYIQDMIDSAVIEAHKDQITTTMGFNIRQIPFPCHHEDNFIFMLGAYLIPVMITFTFLASLGVATHNLVYDRENGQEESLHVMGMLTGLNFMSWLMSTMFLMTVVSLILAIMLKYTNIFIYSNFFIMFLYLVDFCLSSVMLLYMVSAFFTQTTMAILFVLMVYLISYMPYILVVGLEVSMKFWHKTLACLASTTAFSFGALRVAYLEEGGTGIQWHNITEASPGDASFSWICIMMLIDSAGYFLIGWYVRTVKPGKYGISQPWYFPVKPSFWSSCFRTNKSLDFDSVLTSDSAENLFEPPHEGLIPGIAIKDLSKTYSNKKKAVKNLTVNFYQNQITSLLGHNGAAKTTTMNMICGILEPTSGQILINGVEPNCCKHSLGVCPQQNALFYYMTVHEHMKFYAGIKGVANTTETKSEIKKLLRDVDLWHVRNNIVQNLSYGMKRRLCVALAFVGGSKIIILDEPTSGVDPHARRNIWNLITEHKPGRTILLSTHHLDEADILSDRIAIMHQGKLLCCGSPAFLKKVIGDGITLTVVKKGLDAQRNLNENCEFSDLSNTDTSTTVLSHIQSFCPKAILVEQIGADLTFKIPKDPSQMNVPFDQFFRQLDQFSDQLGIASYGLSDTTIEEVFLKMTQKADIAEDSEVVDPVITSHDKAAAIDVSDPEELMSKSQGRDHNCHKRKGAALVFSQIGALLLKRFHHYRRNWRILLSAVFLPLIGLLISMGFSSVRIDEVDTKPLMLDPSIYGPKTNTFYKDSINNMMSLKFVNTLTTIPVGIGTSCMKDWAVDYFDRYSCVAESQWYNISKPFYLVGCSNYNQVYSEMPLKYTVAEKVVSTDELLQKLDDQNIPSYLLSTFNDYRENRFGGWSFEKKEYGTIFDVNPYVWFSSKGYHAMPSFFNSMSNIVLRSQLPGGKDASKYGITTINHPIRLGEEAFSVKNLQGSAADAGISLVIVVAFSFIPSGFILYVINERMQKERQLQKISGVHFITYWFVALIWDLVVYAITAGLAVIIVVIFRPDSFYIRNNLAAFSSIILLYGWAIIPCMYCVNRVFSKGSTAFLVTFCSNLFIALVTVISLLVLLLFSYSKPAYEAYNVLRYLYLIFPQYALGQGLLNMASNTVKYKIFLRFREDNYDDPFSPDIIGWHLVALGCEGLFFFILTLAFDGIHAPAIGLSHKKSSHKFTNIDEDVLREQERIQQTSNNDLLVVDDLSKAYRRHWKKFEAVSHISFGIPEGESFGLLGVNGAGKTTTFRMLTGDSKPSGGTALLNGHNTNDGQDYGYCSQEGGLDNYLTGEETLYFHSRLRGFNEKQTKTIVNELLTRLALTQYARKPVHTYSGGTKRKLALCVALLGDPPILYLDEPTTGMDAATRRMAWKCIRQANKNGQSIVLTSHSMDECDVLCSRIAIMVNGQIKCIGSPQYLKHRFGDGYTVITHASDGQLKEVIKSFLHQFPNTSVKAKHHNSVELQVPQTAGSVADMLALLQSLQENNILDYYSLSQTTLDSVFISFAKEQSDNYDDESFSGDTPTCIKSISPSTSVSSSAEMASYLKAASSNDSYKSGHINHSLYQMRWSRKMEL